MDTNTTANTAAALWDVAADGWARYGPTIERIEADLSALICAALPPLAGLDVLELGSGSGEFARLLAADIGPDGHLLATDIAPAMTRVQTARLADLTNTSVRGGVDVTDLPLADDSADVVVFRMGLMMSPRPDRALQSIRCVLRPGGRFVTTVWGPLTENPWLTSVGMAAMTQGLVAGGPPVGPGEPFSLPDPDILRDLFAAAGFSSVSVETHRGVRHYRDDAEHVDMVLDLAPPLAAARRGFSAEQDSALRSTIASLTEQYRNPDGSLDIPMCAHVASGRAPERA